MGQRKVAVTGLVLLAFAGSFAIRSQNRTTAAYHSYARYTTEEDAVRAGEQMGLGEAVLQGPAEAVVNSSMAFKLRFVVGRAGMNTGGGIRVATAHGMNSDWGGMHLQIADPNAENYLTYRTSTGEALDWKLYNGISQNPLFLQYHPWQYINEFRLRGGALKPGDVVEIGFGGPKGVRMQSYDERAFVLKFYVDPRGDGNYLPLKRSPQIHILAGPPAVLHAVLPSDAAVGKPAWLNVWAEDDYGNPAESYRGRVAFTSSAGVTLPSMYTFNGADRAAHRFEAVTFSKPGTYRIKVQDQSGNLTGESNPIVVRPDMPRERVLWGDIHTHTMYSDGRGTPDETYDFGERISALDFSAVTDHSFLVEDWMWDEIKKTTNRRYRPGRFVTFLAYEWSGQTDVGGDHNVYTTDPDMPLIRCYSYFNYDNLRMYHGPNKGANHVEDLFRMLAPRSHNENLMAIPHFGGRPANPAFHNPELQRNIEIFSDHRRSEDWATKFLKNGFRIGIIGSTDNHAGNAGYGIRRAATTRGEEGPVFSKTSPAEHGTALVAVYAKDLTREGVFQALYHRRTYATTGTRIVLSFALNGQPMGSELRVNGPPHIIVSAEGTDKITSIRIVKNGEVIHAVSPQGRSAHIDYVDTSNDYNQKFYYVDLVQADGKKAVSSPVWTN